MALDDLTWDSCSSAHVVFGASRVPFQKLEPGKITIKTEKSRRVGEPIATRRTPGAAEVADPTAEMLATDFEAHILPRMPKHGGTLIEFPVLIVLKHPSIAGTLSILLDRCRFLEWDGPSLDGNSPEKGLIYKLTMSAMGRMDRGRDGQWKALYYDIRRASKDARALMAF